MNETPEFRAMNRLTPPAARLISTVLIAIAAVPSLSAAGLLLYERGAPEVGTANAGVAARAQDATTVVGNSAGMTRLDRPQFMFTVQPLIMDIKFQPDGNNTFAGAPGDASNVLPGGALMYAHPLSERVAVGMFLGSYLGLSVDYNDDWVGRYFVQKSALVTFSGAPTVGFKVNDWLAIGGGLNIQYGVQEATTALPTLLPGQPDGRLEFKDHSWGLGGLVSALVEVCPKTRVGLSYATPVWHQFKDTPTITGSPLSPGELKIDMTIPQGLQFSAWQDIGERWAVMGNAGWQNWSQFGELLVSGEPRDMNFEDTWNLAIGAHFRAFDRWRITAGFGYDSSPVQDQFRTVVLPVDRQFRYSVGAIWDVSARWTLGLAYTYIDLGSAPVIQSVSIGGATRTLSGEYTSNAIHIIGANANLKF